MNAKATYYLQLAIMLLMSIMANWGYASAIGTDCVGVRQRWVREFDRHGRELSVTHYLGDGTPMLLCRRGYDSLGRISEESAGDGASEALVNEYAYDIRSRAVAVSSGRYSQRLDFTPGGNVSRMDWCADASCEPWHSYRFGYDALARVVSAEYSDDDGRRGIYDTTYDYDLNGNVTALSRRGVVSSGIGGEKYGLIDCLAYSYEGNRVVSITDDGQEVYSYGAFHFVDGADEAEEYTYDSNGNITSDLNRGISDISYDVNNRPHRIRFSDGGETRYIYGLDGVKRRAEHVIPGIPPVVSIGAAVSGATVTSTTDYSGEFVYEDGLLERIHLDCGYLSYRDFSGHRLTEPEYHFYQRDHLGNNRVDLCSDGSVSQIIHYYPFGLPMSMGYSPESQRWKFGNKELDRINGLDLYDFEARAYDPATIRFYRPDDLADKYHSISPYVYCLNNPLFNIDPTGQKIEFAEGSSDEFISQFNEAYNYLREHGASEIIDALKDSEDYTIIIKEYNEKETPTYNQNGQLISWNPQLGLLTGENGSIYLLSPAELLNHESAHALRDMTDRDGINHDSSVITLSYGNLEEKRVIESVESITAQKLGRLKYGEQTRKGIYGSLYRVSNVRGDIDDIEDW
ncbi:RHS repeat-associated core domain-containing protein [Muribaculum intestinale]|uniref:RHS repeat-associated core domain-containing protein n=1 Tax=Muribaculum intestinale TaxID=1796646 RepID=UPI0025B5CDB6|nr:RHS repeat-associated core domain-containing protein [Muribaculum intestinale]